MALSAEDVRKIAVLSRIALTEAELVEAQEELNHIFDMIAKMQAVDTEGVMPLSHPHELAQRLRDDVITETNQRDVYQRVAPAVKDGLFLVPKVIE